jgi:pimeloyl-ACP methyl ester carboxylesterase
MLFSRDEVGVEKQLWVRQLWANEFFSELLGHFNRTSRQVESARKIFCPREERFGLHAIDTLDFGALFPQAQYFHGLIENLLLLGYVPGETLFGFCFDWRQRLADEQIQKDLFDLILRVRKLARGARVDVISHSMGGLLMKSFLARRRALMTDHIANWISGAAPWQGAPGRAVESIVNGYHLGNILVSRTNARKLAAATPVAFQLIADRDFRSKTTGSAPYVSIYLSARWRMLTIAEFIELLPFAPNVTEPQFLFGNTTAAGMGASNNGIEFDYHLMHIVMRDRAEWQRLTLVDVNEARKGACLRVRGIW